MGWSETRKTEIHLPVFYPNPKYTQPIFYLNPNTPDPYLTRPLELTGLTTTMNQAISLQTSRQPSLTGPISVSDGYLTKISKFHVWWSESQPNLRSDDLVCSLDIMDFVKILQFGTSSFSVFTRRTWFLISLHFGTSSFSTSEFLALFISNLILELLEIAKKSLERVGFVNKLFLGCFLKICLI